MMTIPTATLGVHYQPMAKPKPIGIGVFVDGKEIAVLDIEHVRAVWQQVLDTEAKRENRAASNFRGPAA